jgi:hypothetical protein
VVEPFLCRSCGLLSSPVEEEIGQTVALCCHAAPVRRRVPLRCVVRERREDDGKGGLWSGVQEDRSWEAERSATWKGKMVIPRATYFR